MDHVDCASGQLEPVRNGLHDEVDHHAGLLGLAQSGRELKLDLVTELPSELVPHGVGWKAYSLVELVERHGGLIDDGRIELVLNTS